MGNLRNKYTDEEWDKLLATLDAPAFAGHCVPVEAFIFHLPSTNVQLKAFQSPRGLRYTSLRPSTVTVKIANQYNALELHRLAAYLTELAKEMEIPKQTTL